MLPAAAETPLERIERDIAWLKSLPDIVISVLSRERGPGRSYLGPWESLDNDGKECVLHTLDWSGVDPADRQRIWDREVLMEGTQEEIFRPFVKGSRRPCRFKPDYPE
jgi:hypothetical protein